MKFNLWKLDEHSELVEALFAAHREAAIANDNASKLCVQQAWGGSGRFENAIIAGMATIGALHAPLVAARKLFELGGSADLYIEEWVKRGERVPGFGNSFFGGRGDHSFNEPCRILMRAYGWAYDRVGELKGTIEWVRQERGKEAAEISPNAAMWTAVIASICEVPIGLEPALFAMARIPAWAEMCGAVQHPKVGGVR